MVGPTDPRFFDNPSGTPIYEAFGLPLGAYDAVFDFGCGCGRQARQLLLQTPRPRRYVGVDASRWMIDWCRANLAPVDAGFEFHHHDVYSPSYAPANSLKLAAPFPVEDHAFTLLLAHSVFTHLSQAQAEYYLHEIARILKPGGTAFTSWFFFDKGSVPFLGEGRACLFIDDVAPSEGVIFDRGWLFDAVRRAGLGISRTDPPTIAGHQWTVFLAPRGPGFVDRFPLGEEGAEWLCGATARPMATPRASLEQVIGHRTQEPAPAAGSAWPEPPRLEGALKELALLRRGPSARLWLLARQAMLRLRGRG